MKLTDQEQVILKAIERVGRNGLASISEVVRAIGYPKATTKKVLVSLSNKGAVSLHRHDWPQSLKPEQRKLLVRIGRDYFSAVSMRKRNPAKKSKGKAALTTAGKAVKGFAQGTLSAASQILGAGASALNPVRRRVKNKYIDLVIKGQAKKTPKGWQVGKKTFEQGRGTVNVSSGYYLDRATGLVYAKRARNKSRKRNSDKKDSDHPIEVTKHWRAGPPGYLTPWQRAHHAGQRDLFSHGIKPAKKRNTSRAYSAGQLGFGTHPVKRSQVAKLRDRLNRLTARWEKAKKPAQLAKIKKEMDATWVQLQAIGVQNPKAKRNASRSVHSKKKAIRAGAVAKTRNRPDVRSMAKTRKAPIKRSATRNPSAESIRKKFAGRVTGERDVFVPSSTPKGKLAKLGNLVLIQTEQGTIKPVRGSAILLADTRGKLHIGTTGKSDLFSGPRQNFGEVRRIEYDSSKPHLGYPSPIIWHHKLGEESGHRPTLHADGQGGLVFRGGRYRLTRRGIEN